MNSSPPVSLRSLPVAGAFLPLRRSPLRRARALAKNHGSRPRSHLGARASFAAGLLVVLGAALATPSAVAVVTWKGLQFGGFVSQGALVNTGPNDYLGETSEGTFDFREYAVNASYVKGRFRVGAQIFGQRLGDYGDDKVLLDWATLDYQPAQWLGLRVGRVKTPRGLYNEALDVDSVRPFVLMPQSVYDVRLRDFNAAFNGGMFFGNVPLRRAGTVDYRVYYGDIPMSTESGASDYFNNDVPLSNAHIGMDATYGGSLFWNMRAGARVGYSYTAFRNFTAARIVTSAPSLSIADRGTRLYERHLVSLEYTHGNWTFAVEAGQDTGFYQIAFRDGQPPVVQEGASPPDVVVPDAGAALIQDFKAQYAYVSVVRRISDRFELGAYYSYSKDVLTGLAAYDLTQGDWAISAHYDLNDHLLFKLEGHMMRGAGKLFNTSARPQPVADRDNSWLLFAAKITYSF